MLVVRDGSADARPGGGILEPDGDGPGEIEHERLNAPPAGAANETKIAGPPGGPAAGAAAAAPRSASAA